MKPIITPMPPAAKSWFNATAELARARAHLAETIEERSPGDHPSVEMQPREDLEIAEDRIRFLVKEGAHQELEKWLAETGLRVFEFIPTDGEKMVREIGARDGVEELVKEQEQLQLGLPPLRGESDG